MQEVADYEYSSYKEFFSIPYLVNCAFIFDMIGKEHFIDFNNEDSFVKCLDIEDKTLVKVTDELVQKIIEKYSRCKNVAEFQKLSNNFKKIYIKKFHQNGISIRQIVRMCGETKGIVEKWLKS